MKLIWYPAVSLDGYIADVQGDSSFVSAADDKQFSKLINSTGALVVGRRTYDQYHHPNPYPKAHTYVVTQNTQLVSDDPAVTYVTGGPMEVMRRLHDDRFTVAVLSGGGLTSGLFAQANLIDEAWISIYPLMLGEGTRLLGDHRGRMKLKLKEGYALPGGIIHNRYEVG